jgi:hypothetical protein
MENKEAKEIFKALPENEKLALIEKVMPMSGTYRQLENSEDFSDTQIEMLSNEFFNSIDWEQGLEMEFLDVHDATYIVNGESNLGNKYEAIGYYSDGMLLFIEDLEHLNKKQDE